MAYFAANPAFVMRYYAHHAEPRRDDAHRVDQCEPRRADSREPLRRDDSRRVESTDRPDRRRRRVSRPRDPYPVRDDTAAFVCNIPFECPEADVRAVFDQVGTVTSFRLVDQRDGRGRITKRFGFVKTATDRELVALVQQTHGHVLHGRSLVVRTTLAPPEDLQSTSFYQ